MTEHEDRVICASCLEKLQTVMGGKQTTFGRIAPSIRGVTGFIILWFFFYLLGQILLKIPVAFHDGTIWDIPW